MVSKGEDVLVQVSGGRESTLKPCLNIIGGIQPRGLNEIIDGDIPDIVIVAGIDVSLLKCEGVVVAEMELLGMAIVPVDTWEEVEDASMFMPMSIRLAIGIVIIDEETLNPPKSIGKDAVNTARKSACLKVASVNSV
ncbi:hypothetical protein EYZ11_008720 [Aspergillus tanneri]|uniref:Uncharacterized protein n=1 Tax=Aspergillus tanneri TaxID=1220188 RepID=A0A4S3JBY2_9EURO|nr:hypothetical protein EYZ11_008720 [Aspergillus tanneri]